MGEACLQNERHKKLPKNKMERWLEEDQRLQWGDNMVKDPKNFMRGTRWGKAAVDRDE